MPGLKDPLTIDALSEGKPLRYIDLNEKIHSAIDKGHKHIRIMNVLGQRFIAAGVESDVKIDIYGTPGNDLGVFMDGPTITVYGSAEDQTGNTMNSGKIIIHGNAWDVTGLASRGGTILVRGNGGYRIGIHMKEYGDMYPTIVYGGKVRQFFGEYMAGGILITLGMKIDDDSVSDLPVNSIVKTGLGAGIHGGTIYVRGVVDKHILGVGAQMVEFTKNDRERLTPILSEFCQVFNVPIKQIWERELTKIIPGSHRPYGDYYTYAPI